MSLTVPVFGLPPTLEGPLLTGLDLSSLTLLSLPLTQALSPLHCSILIDQLKVSWGDLDPLLCLVFPGEAYKDSVATPELVYRRNMLRHVA